MLGVAVTMPVIVMPKIVIAVVVVMVPVMVLAQSGQGWCFHLLCFSSWSISAGALLAWDPGCCGFEKARMMPQQPGWRNKTSTDKLICKRFAA